ncbi:MAG: GNAT family N-acetyltransferase [Algibacter sp.]|uniref:GNAT family N-acetyltransferase n=1 Tax=Algibacter sp. TaxID=1872428 RepID=UPI002636B297|nr:GNAT family N-acetyltransferase [Algibacter sp.]MDG1730895.1 GNAT family N-acetyltransferase [Algibacter sp.]MDG2179397.1 GNAT family N-acetyltransferase [Algibacter sp.]
MEIRIVTKNEEFLRLKGEWNRINSSKVPFLKFDWQYNWWLAYNDQHPGDNLYIIVIEYLGQVKAIIPGYLKSKKILGKKIITWQFLSSLLESKDLDAITNENNPEDFILAITEIFNDKSVHIWNFNFLLPTSFLNGVLKRIEGIMKDEIEVEYLIVKNQKNFEEYIKLLKPRMRTKVRKMTKEASKLHLKLRLVDDQDSLDNFIKLHQNRWEAEGHMGAFGGYKKYRISFFRKKISWLVEGGIMRLYALISEKGEVLGYQHFFVGENKVYLFQEAYVYQNDIIKTPGNLLRVLVLQEIMSEGRFDYDFMDGSSFHKSSWGPESMVQYTIKIYKNKMIQSFVKSELLKGKINGLKLKLKKLTS